MRRGVSFVIRSPRAGSAAFMSQVQQAVWSINGDLPLAIRRTVSELYTKSMARTSFTLVMLCVAGGMALLLGIVGIYGVISYAVSQRTREIGIRMALGAQRDTLTEMFVRQGLVLAAIGAVFGVAAAFATMRFMASILFKVSPMDPWTYSLATVVVIAIAWLACYLPSRRAVPSQSSQRPARRMSTSKLRPERYSSIWERPLTIVILSPRWGHGEAKELLSFFPTGVPSLQRFCSKNGNPSRLFTQLSSALRDFEP